MATENETHCMFDCRVGLISQVNISTLKCIHMAAYMKVVPKLPLGNGVEPQLLYV